MINNSFIHLRRITPRFVVLHLTYRKRLSKWISYMYAFVKKLNPTNTKNLKLTFFPYKCSIFNYKSPLQGSLLMLLIIVNRKGRFLLVWNYAQKGNRNITLINIFSHFSGGEIAIISLLIMPICPIQQVRILQKVHLGLKRTQCNCAEYYTMLVWQKEHSQTIVSMF